MLAAVDVGVGVVLSGSDSLSAESISSPSVIFPLRLGVSCTLAIPLSSVIAISVSSFTAGAPGPVYLISVTDAANTRTAECSVPSSTARRRLLGRSTAVVDAAETEVTAGGQAAANGTYILVKLVIKIAIASSTALTTQTNLTAIPEVGQLVRDVNSLFRSATVNNKTNSSSSPLYTTAFGSFLSAAAAANGVNMSALSVGASAGGPDLSVSTSNAGPQIGLEGSGSTYLSPGAIVGIVVASLALLIGVILLAFFLVSRKRRSAEDNTKTVADSGTGTLPTQFNPMIPPTSAIQLSSSFDVNKSCRTASVSSQPLPSTEVTMQFMNPMQRRRAAPANLTAPQKQPSSLRSDSSAHSRNVRKGSTFPKTDLPIAEAAE